ncbi:MAG: flagellar hook-associated protein FlgK [Plesiomonas shigelloides]
MSLINIGLTGLGAANTGLNTTSHNLVNMNTPGYTRQRIGLASRVGPGGIGAGVQVTGIDRLADGFLNSSLWHQSSVLQQSTTQHRYMLKTEQILTSDSSSINVGLDRFYSSLSEAAVNPQDMALRQSILSQADAVVQRFHNMDAQFNSQRQQLNSQLDSSISQANSLLAGIAAMNKKIKEAGARGQTMTDVLDARDNAISKLSEQLNVNVQYKPDGTVDINLEQGQPLINGDTASQLDMAHDGIVSIKRGTAKFAMPNNVSGSLGALMTFRDQSLAEKQNELDTMAYGFAQQFNAVHKKGYDINGNLSNKNMFDGVDHIEGAASRLSLAIKNPADLALGDDIDIGPGNGNTLTKLIALKDTPLQITLSVADKAKYGMLASRLSGKTLSKVYTGICGDWAIKTAQVKAELTSNTSLYKQAFNDRESLSGVSKDEEAGNLMLYTQMYQSSAKIVSTAQQLFDTTLSMFN